MKLEDFKSGRYVQQNRYRSFSPASINHEWSWEDPELNALLEDATRALGELNAFSLIVPNVDLFIRMHVVKEANMSSRIEGTQTHMGEALMERDRIDPEKRDDWQEVQNYVQAMNNAIEELQVLPLSNRLLRNTHGTLMQGVRGKHKTPGEFRRSQNWIGGATLQDAAFIPPHQDEVPELMADLEKFLHNEKIAIPHLVRIAISHYQFETIHPFLDGNGRIGRLLITLYLISQGLLKKPSLYLSAHLERNKGAYYDALTMVRSSSDLAHWVKFFLVAVRDTARRGQETFQSILDLRTNVEAKMLELGRKAANGRNLLTLLYTHPIVAISDIAEYLGISYQPASALAADFEKLGILEEITGFQRNKLFAFESYLALFQE